MVGTVSYYEKKDFPTIKESLEQLDKILNSTEESVIEDSFEDIAEALEIESDDTRVRRINKNELSKTYIQLKRLEQDEMHKLINAYKSKNAKPRQIAGDDTVEGIYPASSTYNRAVKTGY